MRKVDEVPSPDPSSQVHDAPFTNVVVAIVMIIPQILVSVLSVYFVAFSGMRVAGCGGDCNYELADAAYVAQRVAVAAITVLTLAGLILWGRRGWKTWPIALGGLLLTILAAFIAHQVVGLAYAS